MSKDLDSNEYLFEDRFEAAQRLLEELPVELIKKEDWILLALSRGGARICSYICEKLEMNFDLFFISPIVAPKNDECEIAMVSHSQDIVMHDALINSFGIEKDYIYEEAKRLYEEKIVYWNNKYRKGLDLVDLRGRSVLLVDEGCETGLSTMCAIKSMLNLEASKVSVAIPIIADDLYHQIELKVDDIYTVYKRVHFISTEYYYKELEKINGKELIRFLGHSKCFMPNKKES